jgi:hypothetical protein
VEGRDSDLIYYPGIFPEEIRKVKKSKVVPVLNELSYTP